MTFTVLGRPVTKKNSLRVMRTKEGLPFVSQSTQAVAWEQDAEGQLRQQCEKGRRYTGTTERTIRQGRARIKVMVPVVFRGDVKMTAIVYRDRPGKADLLNYLAAVSDALEKAGVVANDCQVVSVDGSRLLVDRHCPRVEITVEPA